MDKAKAAPEDTSPADEAAAPVSLVDSLVQRLESAIAVGDLPGGQRISELALAESFGVSRGPLREAIRRLEGRRLLVRRQNFGVQVVGLSAEDLSEIMQIREPLEGFACRLAAENMPQEEIVRLGALVDDHWQSQIENQNLGNPEYDFHRRVILGSGNKRLFDLLCGDLYYLLRLYRYRSSKVPGRDTRSFEEHKAIVGALLRRDGDLAESLMRHHIRMATRNMQASLNLP